MKKNRILLVYVFIVLISLVMTSCYQPNPLTGNWADNRGDSLTLFPDYTFVGQITTPNHKKETYKGNYNVLMNAISFTEEDGTLIVSEWDIRASMLYLEWPNETGEKLQLTLYKTKN